mmetsp:Transcript_12168/g.13658  ORF Transcript_12168/g.13658 Transcript_12168/m.13658 type:complete len:579 (+) Transcript_12168:3-1739(+)
MNAQVNVDVDGDDRHCSSVIFTQSAEDVHSLLIDLASKSQDKDTNTNGLLLCMEDLKKGWVELNELIEYDELLPKELDQLYRKSSTSDDKLDKKGFFTLYQLIDDLFEMPEEDSEDQNKSDGPGPVSAKISENKVNVQSDADADADVNVNGGADLTQENQEEPSSQTTPILSSIVQVDKAYFTDLEKTAKRQKNAIEKLESENKNLTNQVTTYTQDLERKERTITNLELTLKQGRETRFNKSSIKKSSKSKHRRRMTESVIITNKTTTGGNSSAQSQSEDDYSISVDGENNTTDKEQIATDTDSHTHIDTQKEIADAVSVALEKKEEEHSSTMEVLSHQLDLKDKIISRHEMKIYSLLNKNNDPFHNPVAKKQISQDAMVRNIAVTNELMDRSINRLEKMMNQLELIEKEKRTDLADEISPLRRVGTKVSLVHEELKVAIKLIEQKINNDFRKIKQDSDQEGEKDDGDIGEECSGQKSCEGGGENITTPSLTSKPCESSIADQISDVFTEAMKALKETETAIKKQIDYLKDELQKFEFEMATKQDTIEALELACSEQVQNIRKMQDEIDELKSGLTQV